MNANSLCCLRRRLRTSTTACKRAASQINNAINTDSTFSAGRTEVRGIASSLLLYSSYLGLAVQQLAIMGIFMQQSVEDNSATAPDMSWMPDALLKKATLLNLLVQRQQAKDAECTDELSRLVEKDIPDFIRSKTHDQLASAHSQGSVDAARDISMVTAGAGVGSAAVGTAACYGIEQYLAAHAKKWFFQKAAIWITGAAIVPGWLVGIATLASAASGAAGIIAAGAFAYGYEKDGDMKEADSRAVQGYLQSDVLQAELAAAESSKQAYEAMLMPVPLSSGKKPATDVMGMELLENLHALMMLSAAARGSTHVQLAAGLEALLNEAISSKTEWLTDIQPAANAAAVKVGLESGMKVLQQFLACYQDELETLDLTAKEVEDFIVWVCHTNIPTDVEKFLGFMRNNRDILSIG